MSTHAFLVIHRNAAMDKLMDIGMIEEVGDEGLVLTDFGRFPIEKLTFMGPNDRPGIPCRYLNHEGLFIITYS